MTFLANYEEEMNYWTVIDILTRRLSIISGEDQAVEFDTTR